MIFRSTKTYSHDRGLSVAFRQWKADSHCQFLHGYAIAVQLTFEAEELDERGWVIDFGALGHVKKWLDTKFDHVTLVAEDDPNLEWYLEGAKRCTMQVCIVPATGCEAFAQMIFSRVNTWLHDNGHRPRVRLAQVEVREHGANSAMAIAEGSCSL